MTGWRVSGVYWAFFAISGVMLLATRLFGSALEDHPKAVTASCILFELIVMISCMVVDIFPYPQSISVFMAPLFVIAPAMFIFPLYLHIPMLSALYVLYTVLDTSVKPVWNASIDRFSALFGLACGILVAVIITDSRAEEGIAKEQYRRMSSLDQLTGLYNRAAIVQQMSKAFDVPTDKPQRVFVLIDLDNFKKVNDQLGHQMGDFVLSRTGMVLRSCFADKDFIGRSGGDEFMILVDRPLSRDDLVVLLDTVEARVIGILTEQEEHVSCSIGAVIWDGVSSYPEMFRYADESLYEAKRRGRSCVVIEEAASFRQEEHQQTLL
jgi:diguanylate cyclase (GGDEF)-like protein